MSVLARDLPGRKCNVVYVLMASGGSENMCVINCFY